MIWYASLHPRLSLGFVYCVQTHHYVLGPCYEDTKSLFTLSLQLTPGASCGPVAALYDLACVPQEHVNCDHTAVLWEQTWHPTSLHCCLQFGVSIPMPPQHQGQNALAPCMAEDHTNIFLIR